MTSDCVFECVEFHSFSECAHTFFFFLFWTENRIFFTTQIVLHYSNKMHFDLDFCMYLRLSSWAVQLLILLISVIFPFYQMKTIWIQIYWMQLKILLHIFMFMMKLQSIAKSNFNKNSLASKNNDRNNNILCYSFPYDMGHIKQMIWSKITIICMG